MQELKIIVDNRERNVRIIENLEKNNIVLSFEQLPVGDYILSDRLCVERKTVSDFENSIINNRLFDQALRLSEGFKKPLILIEGRQSEFRLSKNVISGTILSLYAEYGIPVVFSEDASDTSYMLSRLAEKEQVKEKREVRVSGSKKAHTLHQWQLLVMCSIPGIGASLAEGLLQKFGSVKNVANASEKELTCVKKIGIKKARKIIEVLGSELPIKA